MIKILHIFGRMLRGGAEMRTLELMRAVDHDQFRFYFCTLSGLSGTLDDEIRALGGDVYPCPLGWQFPGRFRQLLEEGNFGVVHSHVHYFSGFILRQAAYAGVPVRIAHFRNMYDDHSNNLRRRIQRSIMRHWIDHYATDILAVSEGAMDWSWKPSWRDDPRCRVIYNGLDTTAFAKPTERDGVIHEFGLPTTSTLYIHVGRMDTQKNHLRLISIFNEIYRCQPMARLLLVGRGGNEIERRLREQIHELNLTYAVVFAGERSDVPRLLKAADVMIFPSLFEGLPGAVLEACAAGTPVLASNLPGVKEIAEHFAKLVMPMSLNTSNEVWAEKAMEMGSRKPDRDAVLGEFLDSPFAIRRCVQAHAEVWRKDISCQT